MSCFNRRGCDISAMTPLDRLINARRSIRKYKQAPPPEEWLHEMIRTAMRAPSPSNRQPVRFIRLRSTEVKACLHEAMLCGRERLLHAVTGSGGPKRLKNWINTYYRFSASMFDAPALFIVGTSVGSLSLAERLPGAGSRGRDGRHRDHDIAVGLALMSYLLKGEELGLGSCVLTAPLVFIEEPEKILPIERIEIKCFITTGYPDEDPASIRRKEFAEIYREV
jgi:nitroreductase